MVDYSKVHEVIAETNEGILLAEYQPEYRTDREYQSEADLENQLISDLVNHLNYERLNIHTPEELLANAKVQIEKLNKVSFTDAEWQRFVVEYLDCPNEGLVEKTRKIQENHIYDFVFDDGRIKNIFILDKKNIHNNSMQVINQRALCQQLWARNKYLVLSHSSNIYNEIRQYLKDEEVEVSHVQELIDRACQIPEHRGQVCNAFQHIWGYFKKKATDAERKDYMLLLDRYRFGQASKEDLIAKTRDLLDRYPNAYLQHSTLLKGDAHETLA